MKKLLVFDVEGTIFKADYQIDGVDYKSTMWQPIAQILGDDAVKAEAESAKKYDNKKKTDYLSWIKESFEMHKKYSLKKNQFDRLINQAQYNTGVEEFFSKLDRSKWIPVLISGGFQSLIRRAKNELNIQFGIAACEYFFDEWGYLENYELQPADFKNKVDFVKTIAAAENIKFENDWVFVGDGKNDITIAKAAPRAFCINPNPELKKVKGITEINSMVELLDYLEESETQQTEEEVTLMPNNDQSVDALFKNIADLKRKNRELNRRIARIEHKSDKNSQKKENVILNRIDVGEIDYCNTPERCLTDLLEDYNVVFLGLNSNYSSYLWIKKKNITIIPADKLQSLDTNIFDNADFVYKNCVSHSGLWHSLGNYCDIPVCYLSEHTNQGLLENAMANVLIRWSKSSDS